MGFDLVLQLITRWEMLAVFGALLVLIPLVSYLASERPRSSRRRFLPPADRGLFEPPRGPTES